MKKVFGKELFVLWFSLAALVVAAISLNNSLDQLVSDDQETETCSNPMKRQ